MTFDISFLLQYQHQSLDGSIGQSRLLCNLRKRKGSILIDHLQNLLHVLFIFCNSVIFSTLFSFIFSFFSFFLSISHLLFLPVWSNYPIHIKRKWLPIKVHPYPSIKINEFRLPQAVFLGLLINAWHAAPPCLYEMQI